MINQEIAKILYEMALYMEMKDVQFKPRAFEKAAHSVEALEEDVRNIYKKGGIKALEEIPGVGKGIAERMEEIIKTGRLKEYEKLKKKMPINLEELTAIEGIGPKMAAKLYKKLKIKNIRDLEKAAKAGKIQKLPHFKQKTEENILQGIEFFKKSKGRYILGFAMPQIRHITERLEKVKGVRQISPAGSVRRWQETIGDLDILITVSDKKAAPKIMDFFVSMPEVAHIYSKGDTKSAVKLKNGMDADLRVIDDESFGAALQYFTGDKAHNIALRKIAIDKGYKLNEYGLFKGKKQIAGKTEEEIYETLGLKWIPPEIRNNSGEIEAAIKNKLPRLIDYGDLKGDLQIQTDWTDGANTIEEMAFEAKKSGLEYIAITDHTKSLAMTGGSDEKKLTRQMKEIDKMNYKLKTKNYKLKILKGAEVNILKDGSLDISDEVLAKLDVVGASVHSNFGMPKKDMTQRIIKAMENKNVDIIFHPTGRVIQKRPAYELDIDEIIKAAKRTGTILEINAYPDRLDLKDEYVRKAVEAGVKLIINSDAHSASHLRYLEFGIAQARRGWASKGDIMNTLPLTGFLKRLKTRYI